MSSFGWLDGDDSQRNAMLEVVKLFDDISTVDELGIGSVRDTFSNAMFPGTSTLHTRVKYVLFVPWLVDDVARHRWPVDRSTAELRSRETKLINALIAGGETEGVIGRDAKSGLKRMPSELYWPSLERLGVRTWQTSIRGYWRSAIQHRRVVDDPDVEAQGVERLGMAALPPMPSHLLSSTTFDLTAPEAEFLRSRVTDATRGSLLAWLAVNCPASAARRIWDHEARDALPSDLAQLVDDARRVHLTATGPSLLYNLLLAELTGNDEIREEYTAHLQEWATHLETERVFADWDRDAFWSRMYARNRRIRPGTKKFLDDWWALSEARRQDSDEARQLIAVRELMLKRGRARITYPDARSTWSVGAGTGALDYRWDIARRHLNDIAAGLER